jgi:hypothetical protein
LKELCEEGGTSKIDRKMHGRILCKLDALDRARKPHAGAYDLWYARKKLDKIQS